MLVTEDNLKQLFNFATRAALVVYLDKEGIPYKIANRVVWTTLDALNQALGIVPMVSLPEKKRKITIL